MMESSDTKVVILNGPSMSGKDTIAEHFKPFRVHHMEFKKPLFDIAIAVAQIDRDKFFELYNDRVLKETPSDLLFGRSPRDHMIHTSEKLIKPVYGSEYFGDMFAKGLQKGLNMSSDGGFIEELQPTIKKVGNNNVLVIRLHREGCDFSNDSRDYLYGTGCREVGIYNEGTLVELYKSIQDTINIIWGKENDK